MKLKKKLRNIKAFVFDVDGVFTDGRVYLLPGGHMMRSMNVLDGYGVTKALKKNYLIGIITAGNDEMVKQRFNDLGVKDYYAKSQDKMTDFIHFKKKYNLKSEEILTMGDDLPDFHMMKSSALAVAPKNAMAEIKKIADWITTQQGGSGAVREVIEEVMKAQGNWHNNDDIHVKM
ncbi:3-deoxy-D-manno-octulosonate 8-phosphate phosphatase [Chryseobacterium angstadtii]|uniref:3-deoxy-D-manno-octulosonate 8-phosphate phosphatase n=1 Tax=Chryseobacterium angstadtii TaxID=558151 RepID=A0A0J7I6C6_9FLAO|nr:HAD-IIIA family hydrolase [Chryseobacterium angstadtii]KMQ61361.1 3-deoxy-D-manno-octulosonate 8-phosphate phosphatase [Chryseobacterium angstadtii]